MTYKIDPVLDLFDPSFYSIQECRLRAQHMMKYLCKHIMSLRLFEDPEVPGLAIDRHGRLHYNMDALHRIRFKEAAMGLLSADLTVLFRHFSIADAVLGKTPDLDKLNLFALASAFVTHQALRTMPEEFLDSHPPGGWLLPGDWQLPEGLHVTEYYQRLLDMGAEAPEMVFLSSVGGGGEEETPEDSMSELEMSQLERQVAQEYDEYREKNRRAGIGSGYMEMFADGILKPKFDPKREIFALVQGCLNTVRGHGEFTYSKVARRQPRGSGFRLPAQVMKVPKVAVICDTSGSMNPDDLALSLGVIQEVLRDLPHGFVDIFAGDTTVAHSQRVFNAHQVELFGGGGTDMGEIVLQVNERERYDVIIVCTDGYTPWPQDEIRPLVVACVTQLHGEYLPPGWIKTIEVRPDSGGNREDAA